MKKSIKDIGSKLLTRSALINFSVLFVLLLVVIYVQSLDTRVASKEPRTQSPDDGTVLATTQKGPETAKTVVEDEAKKTSQKKIAIPRPESEGEPELGAGLKPKERSISIRIENDDADVPVEDLDNEQARIEYLASVKSKTAPSQGVTLARRVQSARDDFIPFERPSNPKD